MIDLHCHILPAIDDGPSDMEGAVSLAKALAEDGVESVAATPHLRFDHPKVRPEEVADHCAAVGRCITAAAIPLALVPAAEVDLRWALDASDDDLRLASYGQRGAYVLLETPYSPLSANFEELIFRVFSVRRLTVVLAHPERNATFQRAPQRLAELVERGVLLQITAPALVTAPRRSGSGRLARALLKEGLAHLLASDAHTTTSRRGPHLAAAVRAAARIAPARAGWMVTEAAEAIIAGEPLPQPPPERGGRRRNHLGWRAR